MPIDITQWRQYLAGLRYETGMTMVTGDVEILNHVVALLDELEDCRVAVARYAELARVEEENPDVIAMVKRQPALVEASLSDKEVRRARAQGRREGVRLACDLVSMSAPGEVGVTVEMLRALADEGE